MCACNVTKCNVTKRRLQHQHNTQTFALKDDAAQGDAGGDFGSILHQPLSAVQQALQQQQQQQQQEAAATATAAGQPQPQQAGSGAGVHDAAAVAAASRSHLHMPFFEQVDIGALLLPAVMGEGGA
jgi:mannitol-1-phosphate/altronate dehydrogenase